MNSLIESIKMIMQQKGIQPRKAVEISAIKDAESKLQITFPSEYVKFLTEVGDGWDRYFNNNHWYPEMKSFRTVIDDNEFLAKEFLYMEPWIWEDNDTNPLPNESDEEWNQRVDRLLLPVQYGNIALICTGDGGSLNLILTGNERGNMWFFSDIGIFPCYAPNTFLKFVESWLTGKQIY